MKYLYIYSKNKIKDYIQVIIQVLAEVTSFTSFSNTNNEIIIYYNTSFESIKDVTESLMIDLNINAYLYESINYDNELKLAEAIEITKKIITTHSFKEFYLNNKILLSNLINQTTDDLKKLVLGRFYQNKEIYNTIITFLSNNQNASLTAKEMYLHRNTLNMRLNKFYEETSFDVKSFSDAYLIYRLIK